MGNLILVQGPNDSGKSVFAEGLIARSAGPRYYIATMVPKTADNLAHIERHRKRRAGLGFHLLEVPGPLRAAAVPGGAVVLLEDVSNLLANVLFDTGGTAEDVFADIRALRERCSLLVAVTISGLSPEGFAGETADYIAALNALNARLLGLSDAAAALERGTPDIIKGDIEKCF